MREQVVFIYKCTDEFLVFDQLQYNTFLIVFFQTPGQFLNSELTEKLFRAAHEIALDLASLNIQRGRDHALPGYTEWRRMCNLSVPEDFDELSNDISSNEVRHRLSQLYGHPGITDFKLSMDKLLFSLCHAVVLF